MERGEVLKKNKLKNQKNPQTFPYSAESQRYSFISLSLLHSMCAIIKKKNPCTSLFPLS